jgi:hypothetical protein
MGKNPKQIDFVRVADLAVSQNATISIRVSSVRPHAIRTAYQLLAGIYCLPFREFGHLQRR